MNYQATMEFIGRANKFGSILGLDNIRELLNRLGNPQDRLKIVHIAGTNGKVLPWRFLRRYSKSRVMKQGGMCRLLLSAMKKSSVLTMRSSQRKSSAFIWRK